MAKLRLLRMVQAPPEPGSEVGEILVEARETLGDMPDPAGVEEYR
jgi:hypothetical protein